MDNPELRNSIQGTSSSLSKSERQKLRREEKQRQREQKVKALQRKKLTKKSLIWAIVVGGLIGLGWLIFQGRQPKPDLISRRGIHWHPEISITIKGQPREIPANIGIGAVHADMHTHKKNDQIHVEMQRPVRKEDVRVGKFFSIWDKKFTSSCIFDYCNGPDGTVKMLVNGKENAGFENYLMQDKDKIEIIFE